MWQKITESCDSWTTENNAKIKFYYVQDRVIDSLWNFITWETKDGLSYSFKVTQNNGGKLVQDFKGFASRKVKGSQLIVEFVAPEKFKKILPPGTMFPIWHLQSLIDKAKKGQKIFLASVFDGTSKNNPYKVNTVITDTKQLKFFPNSRGASSSQSPYFRAQMAYFPFSSLQALPEFELSVEFWENGVAENIIQDLGGFSLQFVSESINILPDPIC